MRLCFLVCFAMLSVTAFAQKKAIRPDLTKNKLRPVNRYFRAIEENGQTVLWVDSVSGAGIVWIEGLNFSDGIIDFDVRGRDILQNSFVGIAFHGLNDSTYESVYFRPFNFMAADTIRKKHAVQYMAVPKYEWPYLREQYPDQYEAAVPVTIDPNSWFHAKVVVKKKRIEIFMESHVKPVLVVKSLQKVQSGKIGFWVGNNSEGRFKNLVISTP